MPQIVPDGDKFGSHGQRMRCMRMPHPVRRRLSKFFGKGRVFLFQLFCRDLEKALDDME